MVPDEHIYKPLEMSSPEFKVLAEQAEKDRE